MSEASSHAASTDRKQLRVGTAREVAALLRVSVDKVYAMAQTGELPQLRSVGPRLRFDMDTIEAWLRGSDSAECWGCGHPVEQHSAEYPGWDKRTASYQLDKQPGTGCLVEGCTCRRWFEVES